MQSGLFEGMGTTEKTYVRWALLGFGALGLSGLTVILAKTAIRSTLANLHRVQEEKQVTQAGNPAAYATQLKMAFENDMAFGWGTDEEAVLAVLQAVPSKKAWNSVLQSYARLYGRQLGTDLKEELTSHEYLEAMQILARKP
jgi:hypothetical protein